MLDMHGNKTKFERNNSMEYYHMTCIGKTKLVVLPAKSLSFCRGSRVEGSMSRARVPCRGSRVTFFPFFFWGGGGKGNNRCNQWH